MKNLRFEIIINIRYKHYIINQINVTFYALSNEIKPIYVALTILEEYAKNANQLTIIITN